MSSQGAALILGYLGINNPYFFRGGGGGVHKIYTNEKYKYFSVPDLHSIVAVCVPTLSGSVCAYTLIICVLIHADCR